MGGQELVNKVKETVAGKGGSRQKNGTNMMLFLI